MPAILFKQLLGLLIAGILTLPSQAVELQANCSPGELLLTFEEPAQDGYYSSIGNIRGWTWSRCGIDRIELLIDGTLYGKIPGGGKRYDVALAYPDDEYPGSADSGFSMAYNFAQLAPGRHTMEVRSYDASGNMKNDQRSFTTNRFGQSVTFDVGSVDVSGASFTKKKSGLNVINGAVNGGNYDFELNWRDAIQGFAIENISGRNSFAAASLTDGIKASSAERSLAGSSDPATAAWPATQSVTVQNNGIVLNFEEPVLGSGYTSVSNIRGWAVSPAGMDRIELYMDGTYYGNVPIGGTRNDVAGAYPVDDYLGSDESGFSMAYNYANLEPGNHAFTVRAYDNNGSMVENSSSFVVSRFNTRYLKGESIMDLIASRVRAQGNAVTIAGINVASDTLNGAGLGIAAAIDDTFNTLLEYDRACQCFKGSNVNQSNHGWDAGQWSACSGECGHLRATRTRSMTCVDDNGNAVSNDLCPPPMPRTLEQCTFCDSYTWQRGAWGSCSGACGRGAGIQTRSITCRNQNGQTVSDSNCGGNQPDASQSCTACNLYSWYTSAWGVCEGECGDGNGTQSRQVFCQNSSGEMVADNQCSGAKPASTQSCTASQCDSGCPFSGRWAGTSREIWCDGGGQETNTWMATLDAQCYLNLEGTNSDIPPLYVNPQTGRMSRTFTDYDTDCGGSFTTTLTGTFYSNGVANGQIIYSTGYGGTWEGSRIQ